MNDKGGFIEVQGTAEGDAFSHDDLVAMTGLAKDAIEKLNYDLFYIKNMTTLLDLMIVIRTIKIVLFSRGAR